MISEKFFGGNQKHEREVNGRAWAAASRAYFAFIGAVSARTIFRTGARNFDSRPQEKRGREHRARGNSQG